LKPASFRRTGRNVQWFRGGLAFKAQSLCVSLNSRLERPAEGRVLEASELPEDGHHHEVERHQRRNLPIHCINQDEVGPSKGSIRARMVQGSGFGV